MKYADLAMYRAKEVGRNTYQFFTPAMNIKAARRLLQQEELATALEGDRFVLHYQPKLDLASQRVIGVEAFLRWHQDRKSTRLNSSHVRISYAVFCLKKKITNLFHQITTLPI